MEASSSSCTPLVEDLPKCPQRRRGLAGHRCQKGWTNVADPLQDPLLCDPFYLCSFRPSYDFYSGLCNPWKRIFSQYCGGDFSRPMIMAEVGMTNVDSESDADIELPEAHLLVRQGKLGDPELQQILIARASSVGISPEDATCHLPAFLAALSLVPSSPLRHLYIGHEYRSPKTSAAERYQLARFIQAAGFADRKGEGVDGEEALNLTSSRHEVERWRLPLADDADLKGEGVDGKEALNGPNTLDCLILDVDSGTSPILLEMEDVRRLCNKFSALGFCAFSDACSDNDRTSVLETLAQNGTGMVKQLLLERITKAQVPLVVRILRSRHCNLSRLDLCNVVLLSLQYDLKPLLDAIFDSSSSLSDLGLNIGDEGWMEAILSSRVLERLQVLRLYITFWHRGMLKLLARSLTQSPCAVRFLDLRIEFFTDSKLDEVMSNVRDFFNCLTKHSNSLDATFRALRLRFREHKYVHSILDGLANYLRSSACSLVWLECLPDIPVSKTDQDEAEWELANSLAKNLSLCYLSFNWTNLEAEALAASFIQRNVVYKSGQLLKERTVKPDVVKLFICGHAGVGKSTLCRALLSKATSGGSRLMSSLNAAAYRISTLCLPKENQRTRGMELHSLAFNGKSGPRLTVCDLGGQEEFHVLHHYFMHASNDDLFIVVCKFQTQEEGQYYNVLEQQLQYWLRFVVSHRSMTYAAGDSSSARKPKVIVIVNIFDSPHQPDRSPLEMRQILYEGTQSPLKKFSEVLDFGATANDDAGGHGIDRAHDYYPNAFGIKITKTAQVVPVKKRLEVLMKDFLESALPIPKLCHDIAAKVLPSLRQPGRARLQGETTSLIPFLTVLERCSEILSNGNHEENRRRVEAALKVLHSQGLLVYFPKEEREKQEVNAGNPGNHSAGTLVITDIGWFCNKFIGTLLSTLLQPKRCQGPLRDLPAWAWDRREIKELLRVQGSKEEHLEEILRYLQDLELCIPMEDKTSAGAQNSLQLWFPALMRRQLDFALLSNITSGATFFGRRLRCRDGSVHLIPFGVFTRLQVRMHKRFGNATFDLGYGWAFFKKGNVNAVVRFGAGAVAASWESMQWIDILTSCPSSTSASMAASHELMDTIKTVFYEIIKAADFRGIPTVMIEEWVLESEIPDAPAVKLSSVLERVKSEGLENCYQEWPQYHSPSTPVVKLLLEKELQAIVQEQISSLAAINSEYSFSAADAEGGEAGKINQDCNTGKLPMELSEGGGVAENDKGKKPMESEGDGVSKLTDQNLELWRLISGTLYTMDQRQRQRLDTIDQCQRRGFADINAALQIIRNDIQSLGECFRQGERNIIDNCSTCLLRHELQKDAAHPLYPYLVDAEGMLRPLKDFLIKRACLHFMCESPTHGPHVIEGQKGKKVTIDVNKGLAKVARVMVPALRVMCCVARIAATVYLPSAHVFIPTPDCLLSGLGIEKDSLQQVILPKALEALLKQVPNVDYQHFLSREGSLLSRNEMKEAIGSFLEKEEINMAVDFELHRVCSGTRTFWVCKQHIEGDLLKPIRNPFQ